MKVFFANSVPGGAESVLPERRVPRGHAKFCGWHIARQVSEKGVAIRLRCAQSRHRHPRASFTGMEGLGIT